MVLSAAKQEGEESRVLVRVKSNIAPDDGGYEYQLCHTVIAGKGLDIPAMYVSFGERIDGTAREILNSIEVLQESGDDEKASALSLAEGFLLDVLQYGAVPVKQIEREAKDAGISLRTVRRAKDRLEVIPHKPTGQKVYFWRLPNPNLNMNDAKSGCPNPDVGQPGQPTANIDLMRVSAGCPPWPNEIVGQPDDSNEKNEKLDGNIDTKQVSPI
jgi:hypothetical protein